MTIVLFIAACLAYQSFKNWLRGPQKPVVYMRHSKSIKAKCGCTVVGADGDHPVVTKPCVSHGVLAEYGHIEQ